MIGTKQEQHNSDPQSLIQQIILISRGLEEEKFIYEPLFNGEYDEENGFLSLYFTIYMLYRLYCTMSISILWGYLFNARLPDVECADLQQDNPTATSRLLLHRVHCTPSDQIALIAYALRCLFNYSSISSFSPVPLDTIFIYYMYYDATPMILICSRQLNIY